VIAICPADTKSKWLPWTDITRLTKSVLEYLEGILASPPATMGVMENKKMQRALQLVLYVLIPPLRNNYTNLRLITEDQETLDVLKQSKQSQLRGRRSRRFRHAGHQQIQNGCTQR
jgi:hypothetical protein